MTVILFILILSLLVFVHELGHFLVARKNGVKVEEFGFGFPPRLWGIKKGETIYSINLIPLGGFVKLFGEDGGGKELVQSFASKTIWQRSKIIIAGPLMNWLLAAVLFSVLVFLGIPGSVAETIPGGILDRDIKITEFSDSSPARMADFKIDDVLTSFKLGDREFLSSINRDNQLLEKKIVPRVSPPAGEGPLGVALAEVIHPTPFYLAPIKGMEITVYLSGAILQSFSGLITDLVTHGKVTEGLTGPVGIAKLTGKFYQLGINYFIFFIALLSLNLGIMNILPIPALDGGRFLFLLIEKIKGAPINQKVEGAIHSVSFFLLIA
ncbi:site-2 protease family protein, partial [Candidatus Azambacteria bacterium]|nr:site-2 protease family protein [Candidatus Azambacteria bacterium]